MPASLKVWESKLLSLLCHTDSTVVQCTLKKNLKHDDIILLPEITHVGKSLTEDVSNLTVSVI